MIPEYLVQKAIDEYNSIGEYESVPFMNTASPSKEIVNELLDYINEEAGRKLIHASGNYYKHSFPYLPHTDYEKSLGNTINVVLPLFSENEAHLIVFDQIYKGYFPVTWMMHYPIKHLSGNTPLLGEPYKYNLEGFTDKPIDEDLYQYIDMYPKEMLYGLSGNAFKFEPGSIIIFDNRKIHCTSKYQGTKLGLSLRFKEA